MRVCVPVPVPVRVPVRACVRVCVKYVRIMADALMGMKVIVKTTRTIKVGHVQWQDRGEDIMGCIMGVFQW